MASRASKPFKRAKQGQHWLKNPASRTMSVYDVFKLGEDGCRQLFFDARWPGGVPICPACGSDKTYSVAARKQYKCASPTCRKFFSITSGTMFAHKRVSYLELTMIVRAMAVHAKGAASIWLSHDYDHDYKTVWVMTDKLREVMFLDQEDVFLVGDVEIDGAYFGGYLKPANKKEERLDRRRIPVNGRKRQCVVILRERGTGGRIVARTFKSERQAVSWITESVSRSASIFTDEGSGWEPLYASHNVQQVNHSKEFCTDEGCHTNGAESAFSRMRRAEIGIHHHIAGDYLDFYAADNAWREENRRLDDRAKVLKLIRAAMNTAPSRTFAGYWQASGPRRSNLCDHDVLRALGLNDND
ncbi:MAG: IS1595 family transposase [Citromicrobium sp.]|nr:MAG: IS1595 family transposase [Citromicrobium sp.]